MKVVITGAPCSGKSTLIAELERMGFSVVKEIARTVLEKNGKPLTLEDKKKMQIEIARRQIYLESRAAYSDVLFLDRGLIDVLAYCSVLLGYVPQEILEMENKNTYDAVFVIERFSFLHDGLRIEKSDSEAEIMHEEIVKAYDERGYSMIFVPCMPLNERVEFVLGHVKNLKGGGQNGRMLQRQL